LGLTWRRFYLQRSMTTSSFSGLSYLETGSSSKFHDFSYSMQFTWEILWMQIQGVILLQLYKEHNSEKKLWRRWLLSLLVASIYSFSLQSFAVITCEDFVLILKFVMRIYWVARGDLFLLDTTTFSLVVFALSRGVYCRVAPLHIEKFFHPTVVLQGHILTMSWIIHQPLQDDSFWCTRWPPYQMLLHEYCLSRFMLYIEHVQIPWDEFFTMLYASRCCTMSYALT
jgi:hypothetical protein